MSIQYLIMLIPTIETAVADLQSYMEETTLISWDRAIIYMHVYRYIYMRMFVKIILMACSTGSTSFHTAYGSILFDPQKVYSTHSGPCCRHYNCINTYHWDMRGYIRTTTNNSSSGWRSFELLHHTYEPARQGCCWQLGAYEFPKMLIHDSWIIEQLPSRG